MTQAGDTIGYGIFRLSDDSTSDLLTADTVFIPKPGTAVTLSNAPDGFFKISFNGTTVIDPVIKKETGGSYISVPDDPTVTYQLDTGSGYTPVTQTGGKITLDAGVDTALISLKATCTVSGSVTVVEVKPLAH